VLEKTLLGAAATLTWNKQTMRIALWQLLLVIGIFLSTTETVMKRQS